MATCIARSVRLVDDDAGAAGKDDVIIIGVTTLAERGELDKCGWRWRREERVGGSCLSSIGVEE